VLRILLPGIVIPQQLPVQRRQAANPAKFTIQPFANPRTGTISSSKWKVESQCQVLTYLECV